MAFGVLAVRTGLEPETDLYPDPGELPDSVEMEPGEELVEVYPVCGFSVRSVDGAVGVASRSGDVDAMLMVTERRVAVACSKYLKGGGWYGFGAGGIAVAVGANVVSKARAARRRRGRMLVGHVRYEWLRVLNASNGRGMLSKPTIEFGLDDPTGVGAGLVLSVSLTRAHDAGDVAADVASYAAEFLAGLALDEGERASLLAFADEPRVEYVDGTTDRIRMPRLS